MKFGFDKPNEVYYTPAKDGMWVLRNLLEFLMKDRRLKLFDGVEYLSPSEMIDDPGYEEFLEITVQWNETGIYDYYVRSNEPIYSFGLPCPGCGRYVIVPLTRKVKPEEFCGCMGKGKGYLLR